MQDAPDTLRAFLEAEDLSRQLGQATNSAHLLLGLFRFPNKARALLAERGIVDHRLADHLEQLDEEPNNGLNEIRHRAMDMARHAGAHEVSTLHLLVAMTRLRDCAAYRLLARLGAHITGLRNLAVSYITHDAPRRIRDEVSRQERQPIFHIPHVTRPEASIHESINDDIIMEVTHRPSHISKHTLSASLENLENIAPNLAACGVDLSALAAAGELDLALGRARELEALIDILGKRRSNNPILVGPPGVGKTAIVEGLAVKIARRDADVADFHDRRIVNLDTGSLVAGTSLRGAFSERMVAIKAEVAEAAGKIVVFIDEIHTLVGMGMSGDGPQDAANELKTALARGEFPCIGATTHDEYKKHIERDPALERRFTPIFVNEPSVDDATLMLEEGIAAYAEHHGVQYSLSAVEAAVELSHRFINDRFLPDKAFAVIDLAGSRAKRRMKNVITRDDVVQVVHEWTGVPLARISETDGNRLGNAKVNLSRRILGQTHAIATVVSALQRGFAGFNSQRPMASLLFLGPTGVGKTETARALAEFLFGSPDLMIRLDMSEMAEKHSVARLIGAQPGYVGYEEGGQLTEALRKRPFQVILFDEIEKAHGDVLNLLLQILGDGRLSDSRGRMVNFSNALVILTSNLGAQHASANGRSSGIGFDAGKSKKDLQRYEKETLKEAQQALSPELWGRLDERIVFHALDPHALSAIVCMELDNFAALLIKDRQIHLTWDDEVVACVLATEIDPNTGARGLRQAVSHLVRDPIANGVVGGTFHGGDHLHLTLRADKIKIGKLSHAEHKTSVQKRRAS